MPFKPIQSKDSPTLGSGFPVYLFRRGGSELPFWAVPGEARYNPDPETSRRDGSQWQSGWNRRNTPTACLGDSRFQEIFYFQGEVTPLAEEGFLRIFRTRKIL